MIRNALRLMFVCALGACAVAPSGSHDPLQGEAVGEIAASSTEDAIPIPAALSGDPEAVDDAIGPRSCIAPTTCPGFSCGSWSSPTICSSTCTTQLCAGGAEGRLERLIENSFRVCFDASGNMCTEWRQQNAAECGC
jgi:hypothetical protein